MKMRLGHYSNYQSHLSPRGYSAQNGELHEGLIQIDGVRCYLILCLISNAHTRFSIARFIQGNAGLGPAKEPLDTRFVQ